MNTMTVNNLDTQTLGDIALAAMSDEQPYQGRMEDFAASADLVDKLGQAKTKGEMLALVLGYRRDVREQVLKRRPPVAPLSADEKLVPSEAMAQLMTARALQHSLHDYWVAPSGEGPLAFTWKDKPHRLIYDLIAALRFYSQDGGQLVPSLPAPLAPQGHASSGSHQAFVDGGTWQHALNSEILAVEQAAALEAEAERRFGDLKEDARFQAVIDLGKLAFSLGWTKEPDTDLAAFLRARIEERVLPLQRADDFNEFVEAARQSGSLAWIDATITDFGHEALYVRGFIDALMKHVPQQLLQAANT